MSFVKKVFKKKFKIFKKIVKSKWFKYIVIAAAIVFTAGIAAGGFAAFAGVNSIGGFFVAAGQTMATGAAAITGALGFSGTSAALAAHGGAAATAAGLAGAPVAAGSMAAAATLTPVATTATAIPAGAALEAGTIASASTLAPVAATAAPLATTAAPLTAEGFAAIGGVQAAQGAGSTIAMNQATIAGMTASQAGNGVYAGIQNALSKPVLGNLTGGQMLMSGVTTALTASLNAKKGKTKEPNGFVAGDVARGGRDEAPPAHTYVRGSESSDVGQSLAGAEGDATVTAGQAAAQPTLAGEMAQAAPAEQVQTQAPAPSNIRNLVADRGPVGTEQQTAEQAQQGAAPQQQPSLVPQEDEAQPQGLYAGTQGIQSLRPNRTFVSQPTNIARGLI